MGAWFEGDELFELEKCFLRDVFLSACAFGMYHIQCTYSGCVVWEWVVNFCVVFVAFAPVSRFCAVFMHFGPSFIVAVSVVVVSTQPPTMSCCVYIIWYMRKVSCAIRVANFGPAFVAFAHSLCFFAICIYFRGPRASARRGAR